MRRLVDLTRLIASAMPVFPNAPPPMLDRPFSVAQHGFCETQLGFFSHIGTHLDAPAHILEGGKTLDQYPVDQFVGKGVAWDLSALGQGETLTYGRLSEAQREDLERCDMLLLSTGFDEDQDAFKECVALDEGLAQRIADSKIRLLGIDRMSVDPLNSRTLPLHHILLAKEVLLLENLKGVGELVGKSFTVAALPLHYERADGAPARVVAWVED